MPLDSLSEDVLRCILAYLDSKELFAVSLTCRHVTHLAQQQLFYGVSLAIYKFDSRCFNLFSQALAHDHTLGDLVRHITLKLGHGFSIRRHATDVLGLLRQLRSLTILSRSGDKFRPRFRTKNAMEKLQHLVLDCVKLDFEDVQLYLGSKSLKTARATRIGNLGLPKAFIPQDPTSSSLESLEITGQSLVSSDAFKVLMQPLQSLKHLSCPVPGREGATERGPLMLGKLSASQLGAALGPARNTLVELRLNGFGQWWTSHDTSQLDLHDGSRLDLSSFPRLKILDVPHFLLFENVNPTPSREGVYLLLPRTLEELNVKFDFGAGFLFNSEITYLDYVNGLTPTSAYSWLAELYLHKDSRLPRLERVNIREENAHLRGWFDTISWRNYSVIDAFEERDIILNVVLRAGYFRLSPNGGRLAA